MPDVSIRYCVDGHEFPDAESNLLGDGEFPPFRVRDIEAQDYVGQPYGDRASAEAASKCLERGGVTSTI